LLEVQLTQLGNAVILAVQRDGKNRNNDVPRLVALRISRHNGSRHVKRESYKAARYWSREHAAQLDASLDEALRQRYADVLNEPIPRGYSRRSRDSRDQAQIMKTPP
jgi:hypothetical protein